MYYLRFKMLGIVLFLLVSMAAFSSPGTINDYYGSSNDQLLVIPTQNLAPGMAKKVIEKGKLLLNFLKQFGPANMILDVDFSPTTNGLNKVVILFGTEKTNAYLGKNKSALRIENQKKSLKFYDMDLKGKNNWGIFVNKFPEGKYLVVYLPQLDELEKVFNVNHGNTSFCFFSGKYPISNMARIAEGNFTSEADNWEIEKLSFTEYTPTDSYLFINKNKSANSNLKVGDVILEVNGKELLTSNCQNFFDSMEQEAEYEFLVLRDGCKERVSFIGKDINEIDFNTCFKNIPEIEAS